MVCDHIDVWAGEERRTGTGRAVTWDSRDPHLGQQEAEAGTVSQGESGGCVRGALEQLLLVSLGILVMCVEDSSSESVLSITLDLGIKFGLSGLAWCKEKCLAGLSPAPTFFFKCVYVCVYGCVYVCLCVYVFMHVYLEARLAVGSSGARVPGVSDVPRVGAWDRTRVLSRGSRHPPPPSSLSSLFPVFWTCLVVLRQAHQADLELTL